MLHASLPNATCSLRVVKVSQFGSFEIHYWCCFLQAIWLQFVSIRFVELTNLFLKNSGGVNRTDKRLLTRPEKNCRRNFGVTQEAKNLLKNNYYLADRAGIGTTEVLPVIPNKNINSRIYSQLLNLH